MQEFQNETSDPDLAFTAHGHFLETLASDLFNLVNNVPDVRTHSQTE